MASSHRHSVLLQIGCLSSTGSEVFKASFSPAHGERFICLSSRVRVASFLSCDFSPARLMCSFCEILVKSRHLEVHINHEYFRTFEIGLDVAVANKCWIIMLKTALAHGLSRYEMVKAVIFKFHIGQQLNPLWNSVSLLCLGKYHTIFSKEFVPL